MLNSWKASEEPEKNKPSNHSILNQSCTFHFHNFFDSTMWWWSFNAYCWVTAQLALPPSPCMVVIFLFSFPPPTVNLTNFLFMILHFFWNILLWVNLCWWSVSVVSFASDYISLLFCSHYFYYYLLNGKVHLKNVQTESFIYSFVNFVWMRVRHADSNWKSID